MRRRRGHCDRGDMCNFAHGQGDLRSLPDLFKTRLCTEFLLSGECRAGSTCSFAHGASELRGVDKPTAVQSLCERISGEAPNWLVLLRSQVARPLGDYAASSESGIWGASSSQHRV